MLNKFFLPLGFTLLALNACASSQIKLELQSSPSINQGLKYLEQEQFGPAVDVFTEIIADDAEDAEAWLNRGLAYYGLRLHEQANADFEKAFESGFEPTSADMFVKRGRAYSIGGNFERALEDFNEANSIAPNHSEAYLRRGHVYTSLGEILLAISDLDQAIALDRSSALAYQKRGFAKAQLEDYDGAIADFDTAVALDPQFTQAYFDRATAYTELGDFGKAIADHDRVLELDPQNVLAYYNLAKAYADQSEL